MKFFPVPCDLFNPTEAEAEAGDRVWKEAEARYRRYLAELRGVLPESIQELAALPGTDDGLIAEVSHDRERQVLRLVLRCGDLPMGYYDLVLTYEGASLSPEHARTLAEVAQTTRSERRHQHDLCVHELDRTEDGGIEHRLLFHPGVWFAVRARSLHWERLPRPHRGLPAWVRRLIGSEELPT